MAFIKQQVPETELERFPGLVLQCACLFEDELCEVVQTVLPDNEVMLALGVLDKGARYSVLVTECLQVGAV